MKIYTFPAILIYHFNVHNDPCFEVVVSYFGISSGTLFRNKLYKSVIHVFFYLGPLLVVWPRLIMIQGISLMPLMTIQVQNWVGWRHTDHRVTSSYFVIYLKKVLIFNLNTHRYIKEDV